MQYRRCLLYYYYLRKWLENKEEIFLLTTTSSKEEVFHWHIPYLQQKLQEMAKKNKGKQPISLAVQDFLCNQKKVVWFLGFVYCTKLPFLWFCCFGFFSKSPFPPSSLPRSTYAYHITWKLTVRLKNKLERVLFFEGRPSSSYNGCPKRPAEKAVPLQAE